MKMKKAGLIIISIFYLITGTFATEGMWIPLLLGQLNEAEMQKMGLKLTAEDLYSVEKGSLKDAIVSFGGFCTGEVISGEGLLLTNHHCGYGQIQKHSSVKNDLLTNGFWAMKKADELPNEGLTATFIVRIENVTKQVLAGVSDDMEEGARYMKIVENSKKVVSLSTKDTHYDAYIRPFFAGNEYYLFVTETFKDIRLVGAPPSSIGKFGGDTDNWMWPRHTGDFSLFRIYADKDNKPAEYSPDNVPYKPKHFFPISLTGGEKGDFTMVYGFPGRTQEYLSSFAVDQIVNVINPASIAIRDVALDIMWKDMMADDEVKIKYAAKYAGTANYWKKWQGENRGIHRINGVQIKKEREADFLAKINSNKKWKEEYEILLPEFEKTYKESEQYELAYNYFIEVCWRSVEIIRFSSRFRDAVSKLESGNELSESDKENLKRHVKAHFKDYHLPTDKKLFIALFTKYDNDFNSLEPDFFNTVQTKYKGSYEAYANKLYDKSAFSNPEKINDLIDNLNQKTVKKLKADMAWQTMTSCFDNYTNNVKPGIENKEVKLEILNRKYLEAIMAIYPEKRLYPDANSTLRVTYGKVDDYEPRDGVKYLNYTTLDGVIEKYVPGDEEFDLPAKILELHKNKDYGQYAVDGELRVCFTGSNHTTGGNSGSPVIDAYGNLLGCNFDRNWEGTMSDIMYDPDMCRNITCDIRYVLFIIDKYAGATHLIDEMKLVKPNYQRAGIGNIPLIPEAPVQKK